MGELEGCPLKPQCQREYGHKGVCMERGDDGQWEIMPVPPIVPEKIADWHQVAELVRLVRLAFGDEAVEVARLS